MRFKNYLIAGAMVIGGWLCQPIVAESLSGRSPEDVERGMVFNLLDEDVKLFKNPRVRMHVDGGRQSVTPLRNRSGAPPVKGENVRLQGCNLRPAGNDDTSIITFRATNEYQFSVLQNGDQFRANGGGCYVGNDYYYVGYSQIFGMVLPSFYHYDATTWELVEVRDLDQGCISYDMTYDATDGKIYGIFYNDDMNGYVFGSFDLATLVRTEIATLPCEYFAIAASADGVIFAIDEDGNLNKFDKQSGVATWVGSTGIEPKYKQSADFDDSTGKLYWAASHADGSSALYQVDVTDGHASKIFDFPNDEQITALHVLPPEAAAGAPNKVENLSVEFENGGLAGRISFVAPDYTYDGVALAGMLSYTVRIDGSAVASSMVEAGSLATIEASVSDSGMHTVEVVTSNNAGESPVVRTTQWFGVDSPAPVRNLDIGNDDINVTVSWDAPEKGANGGFINTAGLRYTVVRYPDEVTVAERQSATSFSEPYSKDGLTSYSYGVTVHYGNLSSETAVSGKLLVGGAFTVPYSEDFDNPKVAELYTVIDVSGDGKTWSHNYDEDEMEGDMRCAYISSNPKDDWLISPPIHLEGGKLYNISIMAGARGGWRYTEKMEVVLGSSATIEGVTTGAVATIIPEQEYEEKILSEVSGLVQVDADGDYYVGIHACSDKNMDVVIVDNLKVVEESDMSAPSAVTGLEITPDGKGGMGATIAFVTPSLTIGGEPLPTLSKVEIYRGDDVLETISPAEVNKPYSYYDDTPQAGVNEYSVRAFYGEKRGLAAKGAAFVGCDVPGLPRNVRISEDADIVTLTWEPPLTGANGGYIDSSALRYLVIDSESEIIKEGLAENQYRFIPVVDGQDMFAWSVAAVNDMGMGNSSRSNILVLGSSFSLPFRESFPDAVNQTHPWGQYLSGNGGRWFTSIIGLSPIANPQDGDGGLLTFIPEGNQDEALIYSGKIDVSTAKAPVFDFWYYYNNGMEGGLSVEVSAEHGSFQPVYKVDYSQSKAGWNIVRVPLSGVDCSGFIQVGLRGSSGNVGRHLHVDNLMVHDPAVHDLSAFGITAPDKVKVGAEATVTASIINIGMTNATSYNVELWANGSYLQTLPGVPLEALETADFEFKIVPPVVMSRNVSFGVKVIYDEDENLENNLLIGKMVSVEMPVYPTVDDLSGTYSDGYVSLEWSSLGNSVLDPESLTDGFEGYEEFSIDNIGDWTLADVDGGPGTFTISNTSSTNIPYENAGRPMAFQVFNPAHAGLLLVNGAGQPTGWMPHSGNQMLAAFGDVDGQNNDWLISPELSGDAQTITFFARSYSDMYGLESIEVLTSASYKELSSFERVKGIAPQVPANWTQYSVSLPEGTRYFAIRCISRNAFVLLIDDISYIPADAQPVALTLLGYNVYRDGVRVSDEIVATPGWREPFSANQRPKYAVTAVYDKGESYFSNIISIHTSGLVAVSDDSSIRVYSEAGKIVIEGAEGVETLVTGADGIVLWQGVPASDTLAVDLLPGIYVVTVDKESVKAVVR